MAVDTVEQRRSAFIGSVGSGFDVESLMKEALNVEKLPLHAIRLYNGGSSRRTHFRLLRNQATAV